jgi:hypothetical protein
MTYTHLIRTTLTSLALACAASTVHAGPVSDVGYSQTLAFFDEGVRVEGCGSRLDPPPRPPARDGHPPKDDQPSSQDGKPRKLPPLAESPNAMHATLTLNKDYSLTLVALNPDQSTHLQITGSWYPVPNRPVITLQLDGQLSTLGSTGSWKALADNISSLALSQCQATQAATTFATVVDASVRLREARLELHGENQDRGALFIDVLGGISSDSSGTAGGGRFGYRAVAFGPVVKF